MAYNKETSLIWKALCVVAFQVFCYPQFMFCLVAFMHKATWVIIKRLAWAKSIRFIVCPILPHSQVTKQAHISHVTLHTICRSQIQHVQITHSAILAVDQKLRDQQFILKGELVESMPVWNFMPVHLYQLLHG